jgi:septum site-determining protein MinC
MSNTPIELKGSSFTLSVVHLHDAKPEVIRQALEDKIAQAPAFYACSGGGEYQQS